MKILLFLLTFSLVPHFINSFDDTLINKKFQLQTEQSLIKKLLINYDKKHRPSDRTEIELSVYLNQIVSLIEQEQTLILNVFVDHEWIDGRLKWEPSKFNNITLIRIKSELLWT
jgi:hypothetical protein